MKNAPQAESENVIKISFGTQNPHEIAHPASKNFPESLPEDDPLEALLTEGGVEVSSNGSVDCQEDFEDEVEETYIHAHQKPFKHNASYADSASEIAFSAIERLKRLKEDAKRLRYYLDELNID